VNDPLPPPGVSQDCVFRYEQLREDALSSHRACGVGFTLFLRQGMAGWMRAGLCAAPSVPASAAPASAAPAIASSPWSCDVRAQAAAILASILLSYPTETTPCTPTCRR
jgi:hypothetical protein